MSELVDIRMHQHFAHEIYRHQLLQRLPEPYPTMLPVPPRHNIALPPRYSLPGVEAKLQNADLWMQFHDIGTEMIITKSGRRMFPSMRIALEGLESDANYCVLLEMVPIGECRYKFSGSQWVPAGGAEPQSPQRMYLHPDSPASGAHWSQQPILFNKVKLTNNTLDNSGHIVLTSMHKYQPRLHIIRTSEPAQIPWAPQQAFTFPETEFVAVTAYQNDRITKLKIDNNPFAKGFRESGQSRCKRKASGTGANVMALPNNNSTVSRLHHSMGKSRSDDEGFEQPNPKRLRSDSSACSVSSLDDSALSVCETSSGTSSPIVDDAAQHKFNEMERLRELTLPHHEMLMHQYNQNLHTVLNPNWIDLVFPYLTRNPYNFQSIANYEIPQVYSPSSMAAPQSSCSPGSTQYCKSDSPSLAESEPTSKHDEGKPAPAIKKCSFSISAILGYDTNDR